LFTAKQATLQAFKDTLKKNKVLVDFSKDWLESVTTPSMKTLKEL
jgi:hypothetical protein